MNRRALAWVVLDLAVWGLAVWVLTAHPDKPLRPRAWYHAAQVCWASAAWWGRRAMTAERNYWKAVRT
jgi:hypothetical protein